MALPAIETVLKRISPRAHALDDRVFVCAACTPGEINELSASVAITLSRLKARSLATLALEADDGRIDRYK